MIKKIFVTLSTLLLFVVTLSCQKVYGAEQELKNWRKTQISSRNVYSPSMYSAYPNFNSKTTIRTFGNDFKSTKVNSNGGYNGKTVRNPKDSDKGKFGVFYDNVSVYNGRNLSLKVTVMDWSKHNKKNQILSFGIYSINFTQTGYHWVDLKWEYFYTDTNQLASDINGSYLNIIDIDALQGVDFDQNTTNNIRSIFVTKDSWIKSSENKGRLKAYESNNKGSSNDDRFAQFTVLFDKGYSFRFKWHVDYNKRRTDPNRIYPEHFGGNEYFGFNGKKLVPTEILEPNKFIKGSNMKDMLEKSTLNSINDKIEYEIFHKVHDELEDFYFSSYLVSDNIPNGLDIISTNIYNHEGKNVNSLFDTIQNGKNLSFKAKDSTLNNPMFYNKDYRFEIITKPGSREDLEKLQSNNIAVFKNKAEVFVNNEVKESKEVVTNLYRRKITVNHVDENSKKVLSQTVEYKYDGENYEYKPLNTLLDDEKNRYQSSTEHKGTINGKDVVLEIPYYVPSLEVNVDKIIIDTNKATKNGNLSAVVNLSKGTNKKELVNKATFRLKIMDVDSNRKVYEKKYNFEELKNEIIMKLPTDYLEKNKKVNYRTDIELVDNPDKIKFVTQTKNLLTYGFTSSEKVISNNDLKDGKINYSAVIRTEKERKNNPKVKEFSERVDFSFNETSKTKTGYGVYLDLLLNYENDLKDLVDIKTNYELNSDLIDSNIDKVVKRQKNKSVINMDRQKNEKSFVNQNKTSKQLIYFELPHVNIEKNSGQVYFDSQKSDKSVKYELIDGGRNLYIPIWADLGSYATNLLTNTFGGNHIQIKMTKNIEVYAYMYATMNSETLKDDELLLQPVYPESTEPIGWTKEEIQWLTGR